MVGAAVVVQGLGKLRRTTLYKTAAVRGKCGEVIHFQFGFFIAHPGGEGQLVDAGKLALQIGCVVLVFTRRHPGAAGLDQLLPGFVLQYIHPVNQIHWQIGDLVFHQGQFHAEFFRVVLRLVDQVGAVGRVLKGRERHGFGAIGGGKILAKALNPQLLPQEILMGVIEADGGDLVARTLAGNIAFDRAAGDALRHIPCHRYPIVLVFDLVAVHHQFNALLVPVVTGFDKTVHRLRIHSVALGIVGADNLPLAVVRHTHVA